MKTSLIRILNRGKFSRDNAYFNVTNYNQFMKYPIFFKSLLNRIHNLIVSYNHDTKVNVFDLAEDLSKAKKNRKNLSRFFGYWLFLCWINR